MREKLVTHVKRVREKQTKIG